MRNDAIRPEMLMSALTKPRALKRNDLDYLAASHQDGLTTLCACRREVSSDLLAIVIQHRRLRIYIAFPINRYRDASIRIERQRIRNAGDNPLGRVDEH